MSILRVAPPLTFASGKRNGIMEDLMPSSFVCINRVEGQECYCKRKSPRWLHSPASALFAAVKAAQLKLARAYWMRLEFEQKSNHMTRTTPINQRRRLVGKIGRHAIAAYLAAGMLTNANVFVNFSRPAMP